MTAVPQSPNKIGAQKYLFLTNTETGITATAGGGQATAYQLAAQGSRIDTVASAADSVALPKIGATPGIPGALGFLCVVYNAGANACQVFGKTPDTINGVATGTGISLAAGHMLIAVPLAYTGSTDVGAWNALEVGVADGLFDSLTVTGLSTLKGTVSISGKTFHAASVSVSGDVVIAGAVSVSGTAQFSGAFGVHGATATSIGAFVASVSIQALSVSGVIGFSTSAQFSNALSLLNAIQGVLIAHGLMASS